jgi:hypothetical protein
MEDRMCYISPDMRYFLRTRMLTCVISPNIENRIDMEAHMYYFSIYGQSHVLFHHSRRLYDQLYLKM